MCSKHLRSSASSASGLSASQFMDSTMAMAVSKLTT